MKPILKGNSITSICIDCGIPTSFERMGNPHIVNVLPITIDDKQYANVEYWFLKCSVCDRGGLAKFYGTTNNPNLRPVIANFLPAAIETAKIPNGVPSDVVAEYREAELCASVGAYRAASAMLRSTLEKVLKANGYVKNGNLLKDLYQKIEAAAADGILTDTRRKRAHEHGRVLGNDVLHDDWREVSYEEFKDAHNYIQRIFEDFYDDRSTVEKTLIEKGRLILSNS